MATAGTSSDGDAPSDPVADNGDHDVADAEQGNNDTNDNDEGGVDDADYDDDDEKVADSTTTTTVLMDLMAYLNWNGVLQRLETTQGQDEAKQADDQDKFALHWALEFDAPPNVIEALIQAYPNAVGKRGGEQEMFGRGAYPLHEAILTSSDTKMPYSLVQQMVQLAPQVVTIPTKCMRGSYIIWSTLYHAVRHWQDTDTIMDLIRLVYSHCKDDENDEDEQGTKLLNGDFIILACARREANIANELIRFVLQHNPDCFKQPFSDENEYFREPVAFQTHSLYPVHMLCATSCISRQVLEEVNAVHPAAICNHGTCGNCLTFVFQQTDTPRLRRHNIVAPDFPEVGVRFLLEKVPDLVQRPGEDGRLPLHWVCERQGEGQEPNEDDDSSSCSALPRELALDIFRAHPQAAQQKDEYDNLPLHVICQNFNFNSSSLPSSSELARVVLEAYPQAAKQGGDCGRLAWNDYTCQKLVAPSLVEEESDAFGAALWQASKPIPVDSCGMWPLHHVASCAVEEHFNVDLAMKVLESDTQVAPKAKDEEGNLPLHYICQNLCPQNEALALAILEAFPQGASEAIHDGWNGQQLPLDFCLRNSPPMVDFVKALVKAHPEALQKKSTVDGALPLHRVCENKIDKEEEETAEIELFLLETFPDAAKRKESQSRLPLHLICRHAPGFCTKFVGALIAAHPDGPKEKDGNGMLPLHHLCQNAHAKNAQQVAKLLLKAFPESAHEMDRVGQLPYHYIPIPDNDDDNEDNDDDCQDEEYEDEETAIPVEFVTRILDAHPAAKEQKLDTDSALKNLTKEFGLPCFTWELGDACTTPESFLDDIFTDRVGGHTSFATYSDKAGDWPCSKTMFFVCQVNLGEVPDKLAGILGNDGLLQIFQEAKWDSHWAENSFVRVIPSKDFDRLVACQAMPAPRDDEADPQSHAPTAYPIVGWQEHVDFPLSQDVEELECYWSALERFGIPEDGPTKHLWNNKFGGYGSHVQGGWSLQTCKHCGLRHVTEIQFQLVQHNENENENIVLKDLPFGDGGTVPYNWCPKASDIGSTLVVNGSCG